MSIGANEVHLSKPTVRPGLLPGLKGAGGSATIPDYALIAKRALKKEIKFD